MVRVSLLAPDSKLPNLAIMKLAAYHRRLGHEVTLGGTVADVYYRSIVFTGTKRDCIHPTVDGGPGVDPTIRLPPEVEATPPDQTLYPDSPYSIARVTDGCPRACYFCVCRHERRIRYIMPPGPQHRPGSILRLLDDNILFMPEAFEEVIRFCRENDVMVRFEYLDARLITPDIAATLATLRHERHTIFVSWDQTENEKDIMRGLDNLRDAGFTGERVRALIYLHDESGIPDAMYRWHKVRERGRSPFLMVNPERTARLRRVARRGCAPAINRHLTPEEVFA